MKFRPAVFVSLATLLSASSSLAAAPVQPSGDLLYRLGQDTTSVEHYGWKGSRLVVDQVGRSPRVLQRHFVYDFANGAMTAMSIVVTPPRDTTPTQTVTATIGPDSLRMKIQNAGQPPQNSAQAVPAGTMAVALSSPWAIYESAVMKLTKGKPDSLRTPVYFLGAPSLNWLTVRKLGRDSVLVVTDRDDVFHARVDKDGTVLGVLPIAGTAKFSVERLKKLDVSAMADAFVARDKAGAGLGTLSPRDSVKTTVAGATLWIDYGRPAKRGREIFGNVVPYGEVWRTGANAATQFKTDKALDFGNGVVVPAGFYTLWTLPTAAGWKLIVNGETGQWGTQHKPEKDLYSIDMKVTSLPAMAERFTISVEAAPEGGTIHLDWDTTRASAGFAVKP